MMVVGPSGVGKSSLLNSLLCPAKWTTDSDDCHFKTGYREGSINKKIKQKSGPWLGNNGTSESPLVKVFDTPGFGDSDADDAATLEAVVDVINTDSVNAILLVFKATDRFIAVSEYIKNQLSTLEYILGPQLWDHVIAVYTFWGFSTHDKQERVKTCIKDRKGQFGRDVQRTRAHCEKVDFESEKAEEMTESFEKYLGVKKRFPYAFPHPIFNYEDENERTIFFANAWTIYDNAKTMSALHCDEQCKRRFEIAKKNGFQVAG